MTRQIRIGTRPLDRGGRETGFTLLELMIVCAIIATLASIGVPTYASALRSARITKAKSELRTIATAVDIWRQDHGYRSPPTLFEVGHGGRLDPWGQPYMYLNFETGTGSGMQWAIDKGLAPDPSAPMPVALDVSSVVDGVQRKDKFLFPLNTDYDLFSLGPNRTSTPALTTREALDDVIRANDGGFFGIASDY